MLTKRKFISASSAFLLAKDAWAQTPFLSLQYGPPTLLNLDPATAAWVAAVIANGGTVSGARSSIVNTLIVGLKADGLFTKLDRLWLLAAENTPSALTDIVADALATVVGSPTFTTDRGYTGQDLNSPTASIKSNYSCSATGPHFSTTAHLSAWSVTNTAASNGGAIIGTVNSNLYDTFSDTNFYARISDDAPSGPQGTPGTRQGHWFLNRSGASATQLYQNGSLFSSPNATSSAADTTLMFITSRSDGVNAVDGSPNQIAMASAGGTFSSTEVSNFYSRLRTYMTAVGVP